MLILLRSVRGWSQDDLAKASGVRNSSISDYQRRRKNPGLGVVQRLLVALEYPWAAIDLTRRYVETSISAYERWQADPGLKVAMRVVAAMGYPLAALDHTRAYLETLRAGGCSVALPDLPCGRGGAGPETPRAAPPVETGVP